MLLLDEVPTQDDVLPPLCIFSAHSVEETWGSRAVWPQHMHSACSLLHATSQGCSVDSVVVWFGLVWLLNTGCVFHGILASESGQDTTSAAQLERNPGGSQKHFRKSIVTTEDRYPTQLL